MRFTASDRRKKVVYGKSSRLSGALPPIPLPTEDAPPSPERPRKQTAASNGTLKKAVGSLKTGNSLGSVRAKTDDMDIFDVPSEDEFVVRAKPTKKLVAKRQTPQEGLSVSTTEDDGAKGPKKSAKAARSLSKPEPTRPTVIAKKLPKPVHAPPPSSSDPIAPRTLRTKTPQPTELPKQTVKNAGPVRRATTPATSMVPKAQKAARANTALPLKKNTAKSAPKPAQDLDVFDVPSSEDEAPLTVKKAPRQTTASKRKEPAKEHQTKPGDSRKESAESDDSNASNKRKRQRSISSTIAVAKPLPRQKPELLGPQRSRRYQKNEDSMSSARGTQDQPPPSLPRDPQSTASRTDVSATSNPKRTRQRTVPVLAPSAITKGTSSPARLNSMLQKRQPSSSATVVEEPEVPEAEDQTMYDIPDPLATPVRPVRTPKATTPGSATPRQKDLFGGLLGDSSSSSTPMPIISALQLSERKPRSLIGSLSRSKSDVTHATETRKARLIDTLKHVENSSEDEEGSSDQELEERFAGVQAVARSSQDVKTTDGAAGLASDDMEVDENANADSQASQATSGFGIRPKLTYAMARSYLRETDPDDDLLIPMEFDMPGSQSQHRDTVSVSEDEPEAVSQAQAHHELKSRGRNYVFEQEAQTMIDDISSTTTNSIRRNAMIELCTKMANETFCSQLLDTPLAHQLFKNISADGEIIFEFAVAVATIFILRINPTYTVLDQLYETGIIAHLVKLVGNDTDVQKIAKDRKTNLSKIAKESVLTFRTLVQQSGIWSSTIPSKITPQLVALKAIELLVIGLRKTGNSGVLLDQTTVSQLVEIASNSHDRLSINEGAAEDDAVMAMVLSTLESVSATRQKQATWPSAVLRRIAGFMPRFFRPDAASSTMLSVKLCMNLTNNKPKACQPFSAKAFVQPLVLSIIERFKCLNAGLAPEKRTEVLESLILSLGATINLAEFSEQMRANVDDGEQMVATLVEVFLEGSKRASQAKSLEESHSGVAIGYLAVLIGNLCLDERIRATVRVRLPNKRLDSLVDSIKEFVRVHEHVDRKVEDFEGAEGQEALQTYTTRLMHVVERLQSATA
ncbi:wings apart [Pyrenophora seminiperda CCB06]|uniref:Wings apart n=1 Tax=Pyrenophora seminiperda CCB06 TaxID=1302712 RepID=A0A3M7MFQ3_9PLEO|nr:wings apart [Pyrenophora seminiperda CCB06]